METFSALLALWPVNSPHKGPWREALMFSLVYACINGWVNNREAGDLRRHRAHYDVIVMKEILIHQYQWTIVKLHLLQCTSQRLPLFSVCRDTLKRNCHHFDEIFISWCFGTCRLAISNAANDENDKIAILSFQCSSRPWWCFERYCPFVRESKHHPWIKTHRLNPCY